MIEKSLHLGSVRSLGISRYPSLSSSRPTNPWRRCPKVGNITVTTTSAPSSRELGDSRAWSSEATRGHRIWWPTPQRKKKHKKEREKTRRETRNQTPNTKNTKTKAGARVRDRGSRTTRFTVSHPRDGNWPASFSPGESKRGDAQLFAMPNTSPQIQTCLELTPRIQGLFFVCRSSSKKGTHQLSMWRTPCRLLMEGSRSRDLKNYHSRVSSSLGDRPKMAVVLLVSL